MDRSGVKRYFIRRFGQGYLWLADRLYNEFAWAYDPVSWLVSRGRWSAWREAVLPFIDGPRVLEIGFGTGELLIRLAQQDFVVVGLDLSPAMQRVAARKLRRDGLEVPRLRANAQRSPFIAGCFDTVVATFPAQYILEEETFAEVGRLLRPADKTTGRPGGRFVIVGLAASDPDSADRQMVLSKMFSERDQHGWLRNWEIQVVHPANPSRMLPVFVFSLRT